MNPQHTRKSFLAKLAGLGAAIGIAPKLLGKTLLPQAKKSGAPQVPFTVRVDRRAVARSSESL